MQKRCLKVIGLFLIFLIQGCSTKSNSPARSDLLSIKHKYDTQFYGECTREIDAFLHKYSPPTGTWALLTMTKAMCLEEMGNSERSDALYRGIIDFVPNTSFADRARKRLTRQDGDQMEHFDLDFAKEHWRRVKKDWSYTQLNSVFAPDGRTAENSDEIVLLFAAERVPSVQTLDNVLDRIRGNAGLRGDSVEIVTIERASNEGLWKLKDSGSRGFPQTTGLVRIILTSNRMHAVVFAKKGNQLTEFEQEHWVNVLKSAKLISSN